MMPQADSLSCPIGQKKHNWPFGVAVGPIPIRMLGRPDLGILRPRAGGETDGWVYSWGPAGTPRPLRPGGGVARWHNRVIGCAVTPVTDVYPPFRLAS
jgi:hypothetical protein